MTCMDNMNKDDHCAFCEGYLHGSRTPSCRCEEKTPVFEHKALAGLYDMKLINLDEYRRLSDLTIGELRGMNGYLPEDYVESLAPFINRRLDLMRQDSREAAIAAYLEKMVKFWRKKKTEAEVPSDFMTAFEALSKEEQFTFMATFYVDAFQSVHTSLFDELVPSDV